MEKYNFCLSTNQRDIATVTAVSQPNNLNSLSFLVSLIVILIYLILVVIFSAVSNLTILIIYSSRRHLRHALGYHWRISLAISDLVSGLIVTPGAILNIYMRYFYVRDTYNAGPVGLNEFGLDHTWVTTYLEVFGFFTTVAVTSEIYALMFHSIERFICVKYPFYKPRSTKFQSIMSS